MLLNEEELQGLAPLRLQPLIRPRRQSPSDYGSLDKGLGLEFADYQLFQPGDDIRHVDWNHYHKNRHLVVRKYDQHETIAVHLLLDLSDSAICLDETKALSVKRFCAALAFCLLHNGTKVILHALGHPNLLRRFSGAHQWQICLESIEAVPEGGQHDLNETLRQFCYAGSRRDHLVTLSDFLMEDQESPMNDVLPDLSHRAVFIHPTCAAELEPTLEGGLTLVEAESSHTASLTINRHTVTLYQQAYHDYYQTLQQDVEGHGCPYHRIACGDPLHLQLESLAPEGVLVL